MARPLVALDVQRACLAVATLVASLAKADVEFTESDFGGIGKSVTDLLNALPGAQVATRGLRFLGGLSDVIGAGRRIREGRQNRVAREAAEAQAEEQARIARGMSNG